MALDPSAKKQAFFKSAINLYLKEYDYWVKYDEFLSESFEDIYVDWDVLPPPVYTNICEQLEALEKNKD